jgi:magnesium-transporting ATPase (P-type)
VTLFLGEYVDSAVIFAVAFVNALVGFFQESKAEKAIEALSKMVLTEATVRRDGHKQRVNSTAFSRRAAQHHFERAGISHRRD